MTPPNKEQLIKWIKLEPTTANEIKLANSLQAGEYEIYSEKLGNITREGSDVFSKLGVSAGIRGNDNIVAIYTAAGDLVCAWCGTYIHAVTTQIPIKYVIQEAKNNPHLEIREGDSYYASDPSYGCIHAPDQVSFMPVFHKGELIAWVAAGAHEGETGGTDPGGMCPNAKTRYDEGLRLSPIKIGENYTIRPDLEEMICNCIGRAIRKQKLDIRARITACDRIRVRLQELIELKGRAFFIGLFRKMIVTAEEGSKKRISSWNDGVYRCAMFCDGTGPREKGIFRIFLTLYKKGDTLRFDFSGTSPQLRCYLNTFAHNVIAHASIFLYGFPFWNLPVSTSTMNNMDWVIEEGSIFHSDLEAPQSGSPGLGIQVTSAVSSCFARMMFDSEDKKLVNKGVGISINIGTVTGLNPLGETISDNLSLTLNTVGWSARLDGDGMDGVSNTHCFVGRALDVEFDETMFPGFTLFRSFAKDSCGFGKYRGGVGCTTALTPYPGDQMLFTSVGISERLTGGQGLFGGYPARVTPVTFIDDSNFWEMMKKGEDIPTELTDLVSKRQIKGKYSFTQNSLPVRNIGKGGIVCTASGGAPGYGDVLEREPESVMKDLRNGFISAWVVDNVYHVAYDPKTLIADIEKTVELRQKARANRLQRGKSYPEFMKEWSKKKPPEECLITYGTWPDAKPNRKTIWA